MSKNHYAEITPAKGTLSAAARAGGSLLAETTRALKLTEFHFGKVFPAVYYIPRKDIDFSRLVKTGAIRPIARSRARPAIIP